MKIFESAGRCKFCGRHGKLFTIRAGMVFKIGLCEVCLREINEIIGKKTVPKTISPPFKPKL